MLKLNSNSHARWARVVAVVGLGLASGGANAAVIFTGMTGDYTEAPYYQAFTHSAYYDHNDPRNPVSFSYDLGDGALVSNNTGLGGQSFSGSSQLNGATITASATATPGGFMTSRNTANLTVSNANSQDGYYVLGGYGSMTTAQFFTPEALATRATFTWRVTGNASPTPTGACAPGQLVFNVCASSRIDFSATADADPTYFSLIDPGNSPYNVMTGFGPGTYTYDISNMPLSQVITFGYWTSAFVQVMPGQYADGANINLFANYANTYDLVGIDLYDGNRLLTDWTLKDSSGQSVFTSAGRVDPTSVPEPGTLSLAALGLLGVVAARRRRRAT